MEKNGGKLELITKVINKMILDSSVIFKWFYEEEGSDKARQIYRDIKERKILLSLPRLLYYEIGNVFLNHKPYSSEKIAVSCEILKILPATFYDFDYFEWQQIIEKSHQYRLSFYDCAYVFLAQKLHIELITADKKLFDKTKKLGFVKLL